MLTIGMILQSHNRPDGGGSLGFRNNNSAVSRRNCGEHWVSEKEVTRARTIGGWNAVESLKRFEIDHHDGLIITGCRETRPCEDLRRFR